MCKAAVRLLKKANYTNAGTVEFIVDKDNNFYFIEVNARIQVEHPVTEMVTGLDLVHWQIRIARGERLDIDKNRALTPVGHAIECRIYAEDPDQGFLPAPGRIRALRPAAGPGIRDDGGVDAGYDVPVYYDSMIAKLVAWDGSRAAAIARMSRALQEYQVLGIRTTIPFFVWLMQQPQYRDGQYDTTWLDRLMVARGGASFNELDDDEKRLVAIAAAIDAHRRARSGAETAPGQSRDQSLWEKTARIEALRA
jgi:acetyl-CoA carboxylase biotin carboxylase subunit